MTKNMIKDTVLIVDDEEDIRRLIRGILEDEGYIVCEAENFKQALAQFEKHNLDLAILDIWLQGSEKDGLEILKSFKQSKPYLPILMISGHGNIETAVTAIKNGAYDFIEKPFKSDRLLLMMSRALEKSALERENIDLKNQGQLARQIITSFMPALTSSSSHNSDLYDLTLKEAREHFEKDYLITQLKKFGGNISKTAEFIGMERAALHRKLKSLDISLNDTQNVADDTNQKQAKTG